MRDREAQKRARKRYAEKLRRLGIKERKQILLSLHLEKDRDILDRLAREPSMAAYMKRLIREDIARRE